MPKPYYRRHNEGTFDEWQHKIWDPIGKAAAGRFWKEQFGYQTIAISNKDSNPAEINRLLPNLTPGTITSQNFEYEIDLLILNESGEPWMLCDTEVRPSWKEDESCPFLEQFFIVERKEKYLGRYKPYSCCFIVFNFHQTIALVVNESDFPKEKTIMPHPHKRSSDVNSEGKENPEKGFKIDSSNINQFTGKWENIKDDPLIKELLEREIKDKRFSCIMFKDHPEMASINFWKRNKDGR